MQACSRSGRRVNSLLRQIADCPACNFRANLRTPPRKRQRTARHASSSTTAINGHRLIPSVNRTLHGALKQVQQKASAHVNLSRLRLALQGLESERPVTRIALLGLNVQIIARKIARLLLADALEDEQRWEKQILQQDGARGFLIRYGQPHNSSIPQRSAIPILHIPSPLLQKLNVELLVSSVNGEQQNSSTVPVETFLAPTVEVPTAFDGRTVTVNQPVHSSLVIAQGFDELVSAIELLAATNFPSHEDREAVVLVGNLPDNNTKSQNRVLVSDVSKAECGIQAIRKSVSQATTYEHEWLASGMTQLSEWLRNATSATQTPRIPPVQVCRLISSLLTSASSNLELSRATMKQTARLHGMDAGARIRTESAIDNFSRVAHSELQSGLASAWSSRNWRKLSWYKLFWRVDDVGLIISDLVTNTWLPKTERAVYEISGYLTQLGIDPVMPQSEATAVEYKTAFEPEAARPTLLDPAPLVAATAATTPTNSVVLTPTWEPKIGVDATTDRATVQLRPAPLPIPIASAISTARNTYLTQQITSLTTTAQQLVFRTLSISGLSAGLSALTYVSSIAPTMYEAGSIFAVGTVFALYQMQSGWQTATKTLEHGLFDEGGNVIKRVVGMMHELVDAKAAEKEVGDPTEVQMLEDAQNAVDQAKSALDALQTQSSTSLGATRS